MSVSGRFVGACILVAVVTLSAVTHAFSTMKAKHTKPKLQQVIMHMCGLGTGVAKVDLRTGTLYVAGPCVGVSDEDRKALPKPSERGYVVGRIKASLKASELRALRRRVEESGLRDFTPSIADIKDRKPRLDECPPDIVLVWSDKSRSFDLPLDGTVRNDIAVSRKHAYQGMDKIGDCMFGLQRSYNKRPYLSLISIKGKEWKTVKAERDCRP